MRHIRILVPIAAELPDLLAAEVLEPLKCLVSDDLQISARLLREGPSVIETVEDELACVPGLENLALEAVRDGVDGLVVDCMADPGVDKLRQMVPIPVLGPAETAMKLAGVLERRFTVVVPSVGIARLVDQQVAGHGLMQWYSGSQSAGVSIGGSDPSRTRALGALIDAAIRVTNARSDVIILGCTNWTGLAPQIEAALCERGRRAMVIDPLPLTVRILGTLLQLRADQTEQVNRVVKN